MTTATLISAPTVPAIESMLHYAYRQAPGYLVSKLSSIVKTETTYEKAYTSAYEALLDALPNESLASIIATRIAESFPRAA